MYSGGANISQLHATGMPIVICPSGSGSGRGARGTSHHGETVQMSLGTSSNVAGNNNGSSFVHPDSASGFSGHGGVTFQSLFEDDLLVGGPGEVPETVGGLTEEELVEAERMVMGEYGTDEEHEHPLDGLNGVTETVDLAMDDSDQGHSENDQEV